MPSWLVNDRGLLNKLALLDYGENLEFISSSDKEFFGANFAIKRDSGYMGVGTIVPSANLHVIGSANITTILKVPKIELVPASTPNVREGLIYFDTTSKHFWGYDGSAWKKLD